MTNSQKSTEKGPGENLGDMFEAFGAAMGKIFNDPELKAKAREFGRSAAQSAQTFAGRFKDEEVKAKFKDAGQAAKDFGKSVADYFGKEKWKEKDKKS